MVISNKYIFRVKLTNQIDSLAVVKGIHTLRNFKLCSVQIRKNTANDYRKNRSFYIQLPLLCLSFTIHLVYPWKYINYYVVANCFRRRNFIPTREIYLNGLTLYIPRHQTTREHHVMCSTAKQSAPFLLMK